MINLSSDIVTYTHSIDRVGARVFVCSPTFEKMLCTIAAIVAEALAIIQVIVVLPFQIVGKAFFFTAAVICPCDILKKIYRKFPENLIAQLLKTMALAFCILFNTVSLVCLAKLSGVCYEFKCDERRGILPREKQDESIDEQAQFLRSKIAILQDEMALLAKKLDFAENYVRQTNDINKDWSTFDQNLGVEENIKRWRKWEKNINKAINKLSKKVNNIFTASVEKKMGKLHEIICEHQRNFEPEKYIAS